MRWKGAVQTEIGTQQDLQNFLRRHKAAWQFASKASDDYLLARCGMLNALWSGFEMATQASEKLLKAYLLFTDKTGSCNADNIRKAVSRKSQSLGRTSELGHDVEACLALATAVGFVCSADLQSRLARINSYYSRRYPGEGGPTSLSTGEIEDVDGAVFQIWDAFKGVNHDYYYTSGLMGPVYGVRLHPRSWRKSQLLFEKLVWHHDRQ